MPSFRNNLAARVASDIYGLATSLMAATITARMLGPSGRGYYASLVLLTVLFGQLFNAGLGEAAIVQVGRGYVGLSTAVSATLTAILPLCVIGGLAFFFTGSLVLHAVTPNERMALVLGAVLVSCNTVSTTTAWFLVARERLVFVAIATMVSGTITTVLLYVLLVLTHLQTSGAILASFVGCAVILLPLLRALGQEGISFRPVWNRQYLVAAARFGAAVQLSNLLVQMTGRLDLILVYRIAGSAPAGRYSVALTIGALVGSIPMAIAFASFPRLPRVAEDEAASLIASLFRTGISAAIICALVAAVFSPFVLPVVFGSAYRAAIAPSLVLLPAGVLWSGQWMLCRAVAARSLPKALFFSFFCSFVTMIALDAVLISRWGITGAAVASLVSSAAGFAVAVGYYLRLGGSSRSLVPRFRDVALILTTLRHMAASAGGASGRKVAADAPKGVV